MLGVLRQIDRLLAEFERAARVTARIAPSADFFLHLGILNHALQNARSAHQNVVLLLFRQLVSGGRFFLGALKVSAIEVDVGGVQVNRAGSMMIRTKLVNLAGRFKVLQRFAAQLREPTAMSCWAESAVTSCLRGDLPAAADVFRRR